MTDLILRIVVAAAFLLAATLLPLMFALTGEPVLAATVVAVLVPLAALLLAGAMVETHRWRAERLALRQWSELEHPARNRRRAPARGELAALLQPPRRPSAANAGCPTPPLCDNRDTCLGACKFTRANPLVDPVDEHAAPALALVRIGRHDADGRDATTTALPQVA